MDTAGSESDSALLIGPDSMLWNGLRDVMRRGAVPIVSDIRDASEVVREVA